ncbi:PBECR4 domain-containing protein [Streptococcus pluranimalium]|uniref:PBECR4 domain-containing protein n=1 Tax=Streptococcus pluranimalium TaxID=82348 RepID=UPI003F6922B5
MMARQSSEYKRPSSNEIIVLRRYFEKMFEAATFFNRYFRNKVVHYGTDNDMVAIHFSTTNFMHLCGIDYRKGPASFFDDCLLRHLVVDDMLIKRDGTTFQKLQVLGSVGELIGQYVHLTQSGRYLYLEFDYALRTKKQILALTLKDTRSKVVPQSLLYLKRQKTFPIGAPVQCIYAKYLNNNQIEIYYLRENRDFSEFL